MYSVYAPRGHGTKQDRHLCVEAKCITKRITRTTCAGQFVPHSREEFLEIRDWIMISSATFVVVGWFVNGYLNRRHEIAKSRMDHRLETLKNYLPFYVKAQKTKSLDGFNDVQVSFYLYGYNDEIELIERITSIVTKTPNDPEWLKLLTDLNVLVRNRLREQLGLPKVKKQ